MHTGSPAFDVALESAGLQAEEAFLLLRPRHITGLDIPVVDADAVGADSQFQALCFAFALRLRTPQSGDVPDDGQRRGHFPVVPEFGYADTVQCASTAGSVDLELDIVALCCIE